MTTNQPIRIVPLELKEELERLREENYRLRRRLQGRAVARMSSQLNYRLIHENATLLRRVARLERRLAVSRKT